MTSTESSTPKKIRKRSSSYPAFSLGDVIDATKNLKDKLGDGPYSREHMAVALGHKGVTGSSAAKIAACVHFGLLERNGNTYSQSDLANRYFNYLSEEERTYILIEAFSKPALYRKLIADYTGKSLPQMLESIFVRNYGIQESVARSAVSSFKGSAEFVGALKNGVLNIELTNNTVTDDEQQLNTVPKTDPMVGTAIPQSGARTSQPLVDNVTGGHLSVTLPSGLVVSYTQDLASAFAFGVFGQKLIELDKAITAYKEALGDKPNHTNGDSPEVGA